MGRNNKQVGGNYEEDTICQCRMCPFCKDRRTWSGCWLSSKAVNHKKYDVRVVLPDYHCIDAKWREQMETLVTFPMYLGWRMQTVTVKTLKYEGIVYYFIENNFYFCGDSPYYDMWVDIEKFSYFSKAVLEMLSYLEFEPDIIHCHDWQSSLVPVFLKAFYCADPFYRNIKTVMTIHNLKFQGITEIDRLKDITGLPDDMFTYDKLEYNNSANLLKGGLVFADKITTVSKTYAEEIKQPEYGEGLDSVLQHRSDDLCGIVNGIDYDIYNPSTDEYILCHYDDKTFDKGKKKNKASLQAKTGLPKKRTAFTLGIVSRLTEQKGFALFSYMMERLMKKPVQLYVLGDGEEEYRNMFLSYQEQYPDKVYVQLDYTDEMAKYIYAGCDAILMPSRFEPCGLCQLMSLRYGAVPIIRKTGGLKDTVSIYNPKSKTGTGFGFTDYNAEGFLDAILAALDVYKKNPEEWKNLTAKGMRKNYSWKASSRKYEKLYSDL